MFSPYDGFGVEAFGQLVLPAVFKTDVAEVLGQAGSIPVRLRHHAVHLRVASSPVMESPAELRALPRTWFGVPFDGLRPPPPGSGTYGWWPLDEQPPIGAGSTLDWLEPWVPSGGGDADIDEGIRQFYADHGIELKPPAPRDLPAMYPGVRWPPALSDYAARPGLAGAVRSPTGNYDDWGEDAVPTGGGGHLLHIVSDQQWSLHWVVYAGPEGEEAVLCTDDPWGYLDPGHWDGRLVKPVSGLLSGEFRACVCADSYAEFLARTWIEGELWFRLTDQDQGKEQLTGQFADYAGALRRTYG